MIDFHTIRTRADKSGGHYLVHAGAQATTGPGKHHPNVTVRLVDMDVGLIGFLQRFADPRCKPSQVTQIADFVIRFKSNDWAPFFDGILRLTVAHLTSGSV